MRSERITEIELVLPSLYLMSINPTGSISTSELIRLLTQIMNPQGLDAQILNNRSDTYFSQKVRNLKSHDTLTKYGYAVYCDGSYHITDQGRQLVLSNKSNIQYILSSGFDYSDVKSSFGRVYKSRATKVIPYEELISEGERKYEVTKSYERSQKLRNAAI